MQPKVDASAPYPLAFLDEPTVAFQPREIPRLSGIQAVYCQPLLAFFNTHTTQKEQLEAWATSFHPVISSLGVFWFLRLATSGRRGAQIPYPGLLVPKRTSADPLPDVENLFSTHSRHLITGARILAISPAAFLNLGNMPARRPPAFLPAIRGPDCEQRSFAAGS
jgi:hypothetical protein